MASPATALSNTLHFQISEQLSASAGTFTRELKQTRHNPIFGF
jgi:hypothetical protein